MFLIFDNETLINEALILLESKYKYQRLDGKWITPIPNIIPIGLMNYIEESESLYWYPVDSKQYITLKGSIDGKLNRTFDEIDKAYELVKREFVCENIRMGICDTMYDDTQKMTSFVLDKMEKVDYCMKNRSTDVVFDLIDKIPRETIFLSEARLTNFKLRLAEELSKI